MGDWPRRFAGPGGTFVFGLGVQVAGVQVPWLGWVLMGIGWVWGLWALFTRPASPAPSSISESAFRYRLLPAEGSELLREQESYAHLVISNTGPTTLPKCCVRLLEVHTILHGHLMPEQGIAPRLLRWSSREHAACGEYHQWVDVLPSGTEPNERYLDLAVIHRNDPDHFTLVSADPKDRLPLCVDRYKVVLAVSSESDTPNTLRVELLLMRGRRERIPSPLQVYDWQPFGENALRDSAPVP